jgi:hypothetical protein
MDAVDREDAERAGVDREDGNIDRAHGGALILLAAAVTSAPFVTSLGGFAGVYVIAAVCWWFIRGARSSFRTALVIGIVLRALFLFAEPRLSGDVYRYMWDGNELAHGRNPYAHAPLGESRINHPEIATIYPPHAELLFVVAHQLALWRLLLLACEIATIALLPRRFALAYATFPPLLFEGAWSAHVEIVAALLLLLAVTRRSGSALGAAIGVKLIPIAALPAMLRKSSTPTRFAIACALVLIIPLIPFALAGPLMPGMRDYALRWIFNSPSYDVVFAIVDRLPIKAFFTSIKDPLHLELIAPIVYRYLYADFMTRVLLAVIAVIAILRCRRVSSSIAALLLCSPAIHPWYWLVAIPVAFIERNQLVTALALCAPFSYLLYEGAPRLVVHGLTLLLPLLRIYPERSEGSGGVEPDASLRSA